MSVFSKTLLTLVRCHFVLLSFLTAWHSSFLICISGIHSKDVLNNYFKSFRYESATA